MEAKKTDRGFIQIRHPVYLPERNEHDLLVAESSAIGDYEDSLDNPGSSFLWVGEHHHLNRNEVKELAKQMKHWLKHKRLKD